MLVDVYRALHKARGRRGALDFDAPEAEFVIDEAERVRGDRAALAQRSASADRGVHDPRQRRGRAGAGGGRTCRRLYRVHGQPEEEKLERLTSTLASLGIDAHLPKSVTTRDLQAIARRVPDAAERAFVESLVVRAMPQAVYQPANIGHFGLALSHYAHFTSPIRRYPDLVVHRTLKALIGAKGGLRCTTTCHSWPRSGRALRAWRSAPTRPTVTSRISSSAPI